MSGVVRVLAIGLVGALAASGASLAQDLGGDWTLEVCVEFLGGDQQAGGEEECACEYGGTADIQDMSGSLSGTADLDLISGTQECPDTMTGDIAGMLVDGTIEGTISGDLGTLEFEGSVMDARAARAQQQAQSNGMFNVQQGPFMGGFGSFAAQQMAQVPAMTSWSLALLAMVLIALGAYALRRRDSAA